MYPDGKCILKGIDAECNCNECISCEYYKRFLEDLRMEQQEQM